LLSRNSELAKMIDFARDDGWLSLFSALSNAHRATQSRHPRTAQHRPLGGH
jgi:hypothetical protein